MRYFSGTLNEHKELILDESELRHCLKVLRQKEGDEITVINGKGDVWTAAITGQTSKRGRLQVLNHQIQKDKVQSALHLAIAPTKNADKIEWLLEKATELGVKKFTILYSKRTELKRIKPKRLNNIAMSALKQSRQAESPQIIETDFETLINNSGSGAKYIATCEETMEKTNWLSLDFNQPTLILIGPEGDFTNDEVARACLSGFKPLSLGDNRLRTETAGLLLAACYYQSSR